MGKEMKVFGQCGEGFHHVLLNEPPAFDRQDSGHCSEHGVCHGNAEPFRLLRTKDGQNELNHSSLFRVLTIPGMKSIFRIVPRLEFPT